MRCDAVQSLCIAVILASLSIVSSHDALFGKVREPAHHQHRSQCVEDRAVNKHSFYGKKHKVVDASFLQAKSSTSQQLETHSVALVESTESEIVPVFSNTDVLAGDPRRTSSLPMIWMVWISQHPMSPLDQAAVASCRRANAVDFNVRLVTDWDLEDSGNRLGFLLHKSFHLLDAPEQADYLRAELLYHHGGFYLDTDVFCLRSLKNAYDASAMYEAAGVQNVAALGPFRAAGKPITQWHVALHSKMDSLTPHLEDCANKWPDGRGGIAYPARVHEGLNVCGTIWADVIDFMEPSFADWLQATPPPQSSTPLQAQGASVQFGNSLLVCSMMGQHERQDGRDASPCDVVHASTAGMSYNLVDMSADMLCSVFDVLKNSEAACPRA